MFILPGLLGLVMFMFTRPLDFIESMQGIPFLYLFVGVALAGYALDLGAGKNRFGTSPQLKLVMVLLGWCSITLLLKASWDFGEGFIELAIVLILYFLMAHGIRSLKAFERLGAALLVCTLWISLVCVHQGLQPKMCVELPDDANHTAAGTPTGMMCEDILGCYEQVDDLDPELSYQCEHVGWFGLSSVRGRIRYAGVLHDPNEVALAVAIGVPIAIGRYQRRRRKRLRDLLVLALTLGIVAITVVMSQSRGGQLVFLAVLGVYFLRRYKVLGMALAGLATLPLVLLGGRGGAEASASALERLECWDAGILMLKSNPILGVGYGQFLQHHHLTAHNSFLLTAGELGLVGMTLFSGLLALSLKMAFEALKQLRANADPQPSMTATVLDEDTRHALDAWGEALLASMVGASVGVFFLSFAYHYVLWIYVGLAGAYYAVVRGHLPSFRVALTRREWSLVVVGNAVMLVAIMAYVRVRLG